MSPILFDLLIVGLSALAPAAAGAVEFTAQIPLLFAAIALMLLDSRRSCVKVPKPIIYLVILLAVLCASAFLPSAWLGGNAVTERLQKALDLKLSAQVTLQPWLTLETLLVLAVNLLWGYFLFTRAWTLARARIISLYCAFITGLAVVSLVCFGLGWRPTFWPEDAAFGPCPNRNETGFVFGTAALLCFCLAFRKSPAQPQQLARWLGAFLVLGMALIFNLSRSGILIFIGGPLLWVAACAARWPARATETLRLGLALGLVGVLFLIFGGKTLKRFGDVPETPLADYRLLIQKDALQLAHTASLVGVGAGNFEAVFPFYRAASWNDRRALHPESDWVCLVVELGWLATPAAWALLFWCVWRTTATGGQPDHGIMLGAGVTGVCLWLHGFVDMNAHRMGAVWPVLLILAAGQPRPIGEVGKLLRSTAWRRSLIALGLLVCAAWLGPILHMNIRGTMRRHQLDDQFSSAENARDYVRARQLCDEALTSTPLDWQLYFRRAWTTLASHGEVDKAALDFSRARALEPNLSELPVQEFQYWWAFGQPQQTSLALEECFRRGGWTEAMFDHVFSLCKNDTGLVRALLVPASRQPATQLRYLRDAPPGLFSEMLEITLRSPLARWSGEQRKALFRLWAGQAERSQLAAYLESHPAQMPFAWSALARVKARADQHEDACELIIRWIKTPKLPDLSANESSGSLRRRLDQNPRDYGAAFLLYTRLRREGDAPDAVRVLTNSVARANAPAYFHYLLFQEHFAGHDWRAACAAWQHYDDALLQNGSK